MAPRRTALAADTDTTIVKHKRAWGWFSFIVVLSTLLPPLAVAARFGIGRDFWINIPLTLAGYIPGHVHNFYIQTVRNNKTHARTPKWAIRYGLVDITKIERNKKRSEWAGRYNGRNAPGDYERQEVDEGQIPDPQPADGADAATPNTPQLWKPEDEGYYAEGARRPQSTVGSVVSRDSGTSSGGGRWHYPANSDTAEEVVPSNRHLKKSGKKDRFARTEDAMAVGAKKKKKKSLSRHGTLDGPEDPVGIHGRRGESSLVGAPESTFDHQF